MPDRINPDIISFPPIVGKTPAAIILGSMPGKESLKQSQYYAHPRNSFWNIVCTLLGHSPEKLTYHAKCELLKSNNIALWDVLKSCRREGSLDSAIESKSIIVNDFNFLYTSHPSIKTIYFNGIRAEQEYRKKVLPYLKDRFKKHEMIRLPSTSPAMALLTAQEKIEKWSVITRSISS